MASKALLFLLAFVLLVSTQLQVASTEEEISTDRLKHHHHHRHRHHHGHAEDPDDAQEDLSNKAQVYPLEEAPAHHHHHDNGDCVKLCVGPEGYCRRSKDVHGKKKCEKACVACCDQYKCVPEAKKKCTWDKVWYDKQEVKCP